MPRDCLRIIESKSKVRNSRNKPVVAKVECEHFPPESLLELLCYKEMVKAYSDREKSHPPAPTPVKAVEESCVTCGGAHSYQTCPATSGNVYRDNIQEYVSQAAAANYNQGNTGYRAPISNQIRPPGFPPHRDVPPRLSLLSIMNQSSEPCKNAPVSASRPNQKASIPFPSRRNDERRREKANDQIEKFYEIFWDLSFEISFTDAKIAQPSIPIKQVYQRNLVGPGRFLIPCEFSGINTCNALADLGASINLMPYSVWKTLSLPELTPTCMTLELADRSISEPIGIAEDVYVTVGKFQFPTDFVVVNFEPDPRVPLILKRSFLKTIRALIDVYEGEITLRVGREAHVIMTNEVVGPKIRGTHRLIVNHMTVNRIDVTDMDEGEELLSRKFLVSQITSHRREAILKESDTITTLQGNYFREKLKDDLRYVKLNNEKSSVNEPPEVELKDLPPHLEYAFLVVNEKDLYIQILMEEDYEPTVTAFKGGLNPINPRSFQKKVVEKFLTFPLPRILHRSCKFIQLSTVTVHWGASVLGQRKNKHFQPIHYASKTMTEAQAHYTTTEKELLAVVYAFEKFRSYLVLSKSIVYTDHSAIKYLFAKKDAKPRLMRWILLLQEFDVIIRDKKGAENLAADHLSRLENPHQDKLENKEITETFPLETLGSVALRVDSTPWFADFANLHMRGTSLSGMSSQQKTSFSKYVTTIFLG
ncbi:reverse transcriptase domain-containing protein [Tanacetum coccineum]|uniref:Reverse transcriptase domain-containing protein n=1 Tax=Tanacetum coccineum TaxID=301880 RepID=A0ABQ4Z8L8_9ASTR